MEKTTFEKPLNNHDPVPAPQATKVPPVKPLYALMSYNDSNSVTILGFYPVDWAGQPDDSREPFFRGQVMIKHSNTGQLVPYNFNFPTTCVRLIDAVNQWKEMVAKGFEELQSNMIREALLNHTGART
jgi:hypothetical protein